MSSKSKSSSTTTTDMGPWKVQAPYLEDAFKQAQNLYNTNSATPGYTGDFYAGMNPTQKALVDTGVNYFTGTGQNMATELTNASSGLAATGGQGLVNSAQGLYDLANGDSTGSNIANANRYAQNPYIDQMVNAATYDANRNAAENVVPNLYRNAAASGNINSDRTALAQGVVDRGLAENAQNISAQLRGNAYSNGLQMAQQDQQQQAQNLSNAGNMYDALVARGAGGLSDAFNMETQSLGNAANYATMNQTEAQNQLQNDYQKQQYAEQRPYNLLNNYYSIIGSNNWGQNGTQTTNTTSSSSPGIGSVIGGALGGIGSLLGAGSPFGAFGALSGFGGLLGSSNAASASSRLGFASPMQR